MSEHDTLTEESTRSEWLGIVVRTVLTLAVLAGAYVGAAQYFGHRVPNGTTVQGVAIGNLTPDTAAETLEARLEPLRTDPVVVRVDGDELQLDPARSGLGIDLDSTLQGMTEVSYDPEVLWDRITDNGSELPLQLDIDRAALEQALETRAAEFDAEPKEGEVWLSLGRAHTSEPQAGRELDVVATASAVERSWPEGRLVTGTHGEVAPLLSTAEIERFVTGDVEPALSASIVVVSGDRSAKVTPNQLSRLLTVEQTPEHTLRLVLDEVGLLEIVHGALPEAERPARDASVRIGADNRPEIVPARVGTELDDDSIIAEVSGALMSAERTVEVATTKVQPGITQREASSWRVNQVMAEFRSEFPTGAANKDRTANIRVGLRHVDGAVVMPGEQFSLGDRLSPITTERGYVEAGVIVDGRLVEGIGGGLSQVSTTVLNTAWFSGVQIDEFTPHSYYISRYPEGREATISVPLIDNRWTNDTDSPVLVQTWASGNEIVMRFWGDRQYTVETVTGERRKVVEPGEDTDDSPDCLPQSAQEGFEVTVTRILEEDGSEVDRQSYTTTYKASDEIDCADPDEGADKDPDEDPDEDADEEPDEDS